MTAADHTVVVRLRPERQALEATLVSSRAGVPSSTTLLPISDLEDPGVDGIADGDPVAVPVTVDRGGERRTAGGATGGIPPVLMPTTRGSVAVLGAVRSLRTPRPFAPPVADVAAADPGSRDADRRPRRSGLRPAQHGPGALAGGRRHRRRDRAVAPAPRALEPGLDAAARRRSGRGVCGPRTGLLAPGGRGARRHRRAHGAAEPPVFRRVLRAAGTPAAGRRRRGRADGGH